MNAEFVDILRQPDSSAGATDASPFRFEERDNGPCNHVKFTYEIGATAAKITVYPSGSPVRYLKLRFRGDLSFVESVYGEHWERVGGEAYAEWRSVMGARALPWICYLKGAGRFACYGVRVQPDCFPFWQVDARGITLFLNLCNGNVGTDLREPLVACELVRYVSPEGEDAYTAAKKFSRLLIDTPVMPAEPVFGANNWYWAYGKISHESVMRECDYLMRMCEGVKHSPYMIIDDGWQFNRTYTEGGAYIGGPWEMPNARFGDMAKTAEGIHKKGAKSGLWFRPLLTLGEFPDEARLTKSDRGGFILDASHPYTLERVERDAARIRSWGFDLIKHDFTTIDTLGINPFSGDRHLFGFMRAANCFYDKTKTTATVLKNLYRAIQKGAGGAEVIGCNTLSHLTAGVHSVYRTGNDTSGRHFEWTRRYGVNSVMRLPQNDLLYRVDPDCAAFTEKVDPELNLDYLEMCAVTGMTTLASVTPDILTSSQMKRINEIYRIADEDKMRLGIRYYDRTANPEIFASEDGKTVYEYDWEKAYDGARSVVSWLQ